MAARVRHRRINVAGVDTFIREGGDQDAPLILLPHGYPCSSYAYRHLIPALADQWRLVAPDFPGCGLTTDPVDFTYDFDTYAAWLSDLVDVLEPVDGAHAIWLHDFGSQIGLRYAMAHPDRIAALVISNGDIYEQALGPGYEALRKYWADPSLSNLSMIQSAVSAEGFRDEVLNDLPDRLADQVPPEMWDWHWSLMTPSRRDIAVRVIAGLRENLQWFPRYQQFLREHRPPTLMLWGPHDRYMPEASARAYLQDLPDAELHLLDAGHWVLETAFDECVPLLRGFLECHLPTH